MDDAEPARSAGAGDDRRLIERWLRDAVNGRPVTWVDAGIDESE
jgi:hypothetical protein